MINDEHICTEQEDQMLAYMEAGEWDQIEVMKEEVTKIEVSEEDKLQFHEDYTNAYRHYQDNHEAPEEEREANTKAQVEEENAAA